jgi:hypothetical protein
VPKKSWGVWLKVAFLRHCWRVVDGDVMALFKEFHVTCRFDKFLNACSLQ